MLIIVPVSSSFFLSTYYFYTSSSIFESLENTYDLSIMKHRYSHLLDEVEARSLKNEFIGLNAVYDLSLVKQSGKDEFSSQVIELIRPMIKIANKASTHHEYFFPYTFVFYRVYPVQGYVIVNEFKDDDWGVKLSIILILSYITMIIYRKIQSDARNKAIYKMISYILHESKSRIVSVEDEVRARSVRALLLLVDNSNEEDSLVYLKLPELIQKLVLAYCENVIVTREFGHGVEELFILDLDFYGCFSNIVKNAAIRTENGTVHIVVDINKGFLKFTVINSVLSLLSYTERQKILRKQATKRSGLSITHDFLKRKKGKLELSCTENTTAVTAFIPMSLLKKVIQSPENDENVEKYRRLRIAVIDDEEEELFRVKRGLNKAGLQCQLFSTTRDFFEALVNGAKYDIVLVDRHGTYAKDEISVWDAVEDNFPRSCVRRGFKGKIILHSRAATKLPKGSGFDLVLDKFVIQDWKNDVFSRFINDLSPDDTSSSL